jgi:DNA-binding CsgD family transcriptional regulator
MDGRYRLLTFIHHLYFAPGSREWWAHVTREFGVTGATMLSRNLVTSSGEGLLSHLQRVLNVHRRLSTVEDMLTGLTDVVDRLSHGVVLVGVSGFVVHANRSAEELFSADDGVRLQERELRADKVADTATLKALIANAMSSTSRDKDGGALAVIARKSGRPPLRVLVTPLAQRPIAYSEDTPAALVFITDPEKMPLPSQQHLQRLFSLTPAEARVAMALLDGESVERLADHLGISRNTARTHLRRLFAKTNTKRQGELIRVLLGAHLPIRFD